VNGGDARTAVEVLYLGFDEGGAAKNIFKRPALKKTAREGWPTFQEITRVKWKNKSKLRSCLSNRLSMPMPKCLIISIHSITDTPGYVP